MRLKLRKLLILAAAAGAGMLFYKAQRTFTAPGTDAEPGQNLYGNLAGPGSLVQTLREGAAQRDAELARKQGIPDNYTPPSSSAARPPTLGKPQFDDTFEDLAIIEAAARGDEEKVQKRIAAHARVDSRDAQRRTALMYACWNGYSDIISRLIAAGANPEFQDRAGNNAYDYAAGRGMINNLRYLLRRTGAKDDNHYMEYAMIIAAAFAGDVSMLPPGDGKLASVNRINPEGQAPLHIAAGNGSVSLIEALIARGADVNIANDSRQTPLHWAAWNNQSAVVELLIEKGADVTIPDLAGNTALLMAAQSGGYGSVKVLLDNGANRYTANKQGKTAALVAEDNGHTDLAAILK